jgi:RimJ/RimL family protein N-acetyltransferase
MFQYVDRPAEWTFPAFVAYLRRRRSAPRVCFWAIILRATEQPIGVTAYLDSHLAHRRLEVGATWIAPAHQGTAVNPESKYLLLRHAFGDQGALRVQIKTDIRNTQSRRAIEKLGARQEAILRNHVILPDGYVRTSVLYSILDTEWPAVRAGLEARLGYVP